MDKILFIGDLHFKINNNEITDVLIEQTLNSIEKYSTQYGNKFLCVIGGDVLDTHERLHQIPYNKAINFFENITKKCKLVVLVGNHDYQNNQQFLSDKHWMNSLKKWNNIYIADNILSIEDFIFVPYVPPGRFKEALDTFIDKDWRDAKCIFAHQEFKGCVLGTEISQNGDKWPLHYPLVISGHIHKPHQPQKNIIYPGSVIQHNFGEENNETGLLFLDFENQEIKMEKIQINIPVVRTIKINATDFEQILKSIVIKPLERIRIICIGTEENFKKIKKTNIYNNLIVGITIIFKTDQQQLNEVIQNETDYKSFEDAMKEFISDDTNLSSLFNKIKNNNNLSYDELYDTVYNKV